MKTNINGHDSPVKVNPDWFTGKVWMKNVSAGIESVDHIYHVHFVGGARTKLHRHDGPQTLIVTSGMGSLVLFHDSNEMTGRLEIKPFKTISLVPGDAVFIPAGVLHTHGSTRGDEEFVHIAINRTSDGGYNTDWYESDLQSYASKI